MESTDKKIIKMLLDFNFFSILIKPIVIHGSIETEKAEVYTIQSELVNLSVETFYYVRKNTNCTE